MFSKSAKVIGVAALAALACSCGGQVSDAEDESTTANALMLGGSPLECADPAPVSLLANQKDYFVFCTGMSHVWQTSNWSTFSDGRSKLKFDFTGAPAGTSSMGSWWAPGVIYESRLKEYVMWVSVVDDRFKATTRSILVFTAPTPLGTWKYFGYGVEAQSSGEMNIDPYITRSLKGDYYVFWKRYGGNVPSRISGSALGPYARARTGATVDLIDGYSPNGGWEDNVRENPAVWQNPASGNWHMLYSGAHWADDSYATGHAHSTCGPLCGWTIDGPSDRGIPQVMQTKNDKTFAHGGPGGAAYLGNTGLDIVFAAASRSSQGDSHRYLFKQTLKWDGTAPYVDNAGHHPSGY